jgi:hypothetical protein
MACAACLHTATCATDAARAFRAWEAEHRPGAARLPIFSLTANVLDEHRRECEDAGMARAAHQKLIARMLAFLCGRSVIRLAAAC